MFKGLVKKCLEYEILFFIFTWMSTYITIRVEVIFAYQKTVNIWDSFP